MYYLGEDSEDIHIITDCQNAFDPCDEIASGFCVNNMCKTCCENAGLKEFCCIHDDELNFYRKKYDLRLVFLI